MHELSIVTYVVKQVQEIAEKNNLTEIESVTLEFGEVSGIVPEYLEDCWNWYTKKEPIIQGTKFLYEIIPAVTWCDDCKPRCRTVSFVNYRAILKQCRISEKCCHRKKSIYISTIPVIIRETLFGFSVML